MRISIFALATVAISAQSDAAVYTRPKWLNNLSLPSVPSSSSYSFSLRPTFLVGPYKSIRGFFQRPSIVGTLQSRIVELERKIRAGKEEARQLRALLQAQRGDRRKSMVNDTKRSIEIERILKVQIATLNAKLDELSGVKVEIEALLKQEKEHALNLQKMLEEERGEKEKLIQKHRAELDEMHKKLMSKVEDHSREIEKEKNTIATLTREIEKVKKDAEEAIAAEKERCRKLEKEKKEAQEEVEKEKAKMRKLVKALAEREKKDIGDGKKQTTKVTQNSSTTTILQQQPTKVANQRGRKP